MKVILSQIIFDAHGKTRHLLYENKYFRNKEKSLEMLQIQPGGD